MLAGVILAGPAFAQEAGPDAPPAANRELAQQFLRLAKSAILKKDAKKAVEALEKAVGHDPSLLEASYRLAKLHQAGGSAHEAARQFEGFLKAAGAAGRLSAGESRWKADAEAQLRRMAIHPKKWRALGAAWAKRFRALAGGHGGSPSCVRALEIASALADDEQIAAELDAAGKLLDGAAPAMPAKPDVEGAKLLLEKAALKRQQGKPAEVAELLTRAVGLSVDLETLVTLAELQLSLAKPAEAAATAAAAARAVTGKKVKPKRKKRFAPRIAAVLAKADPTGPKVEALLKQFATPARALARQSRSANDLDTARQIESLLAELIRAGQALTGPQAKLGKRPNLRSEYVKLQAPAGARVVRSDSSIEYSTILSNSHRGGARALVGLARFHCGQRVRATWRVEQTAPKPASFGSLAVGFLPSTGVRVTTGRGLVDLSFSARDSLLYKADEQTRRDLYSKNGSYEIGFEKRGGDVTILVNRRELARLRMSRRRQTEAASKPMVLWLSVNGRYGKPVGLKATLTQFDCSADCIRPVAAPGR